MSNVISNIDAMPNPISNDGSQNSTVTATVSPAAAGISVDWSVQGGVMISTSPSMTDANGVATLEVKSVPGSTMVTVGATTADDSTGMTMAISTYTPYTIPVVINATEADNWTLDHYDLNFGVQAQIPVYTGVAPDQIVNFYWGTVDSIEFIVTANNLPPYTINVNKDMAPECLLNGNYDVYYSVTTPGGNVRNSAKIPLIVADEGQVVPTEPKPAVPEADPWINIADAGNGVIVNVDYPSLATGDTVTCFWTGYDSAQRKLEAASTTLTKTVAEGSDHLSFTIPTATFYPNSVGYYGHADVFYKVQHADGSAETVSVTLQCLVDTQ